MELMELEVEPLLGLQRLIELFLDAESYRGNGYSLWLCGRPEGSEESDAKLSDEGLLRVDDIAMSLRPRRPRL